MPLDHPDPIREDGGLNLYRFCRNNAIIYIDLWGLDEYAAVVLTAQGSVAYFGGEGGYVYAFDKCGNIYQFDYVGGNIGIGGGFVAGIQMASVEFDDPKDFAGWGIGVSAWGALKKGAIVEKTRTVLFDVNAQSFSFGAMFGVGASVGGGVTYTWYKGVVNLKDVPEKVRGIIEDYLKERDQKCLN